MKGEMTWHTVAGLLARALLLAAAILLGAALDAGLLDRTLAERVCRVLERRPEARPSGSSSSSQVQIPSQLLR